MQELDRRLAIDDSMVIGEAEVHHGSHHDLLIADHGLPVFNRKKGLSWLNRFESGSEVAEKGGFLYDLHPANLMTSLIDL